MSENCDVLVTKDRNAVLINSAKVCLPGLLVSLLGVFKSLPRVVRCGLDNWRPEADFALGMTDSARNFAAWRLDHNIRTF